MFGFSYLPRPSQLLRLLSCLPHLHLLHLCLCCLHLSYHLSLSHPSHTAPHASANILSTIQSDLPYRSRPFQHPCIFSILKEFVFTSSCGMSLAEKRAHLFRSSIQEGPQATELEVPMAMLCAAATVVLYLATLANGTGVN